MRKAIITTVVLFASLGVGIVTPHNATLVVLLAIAVLGAGVTVASVRKRRHA
ncbi:MAG: hypothetical protein H8D78_04895 [Chloroflexi bacterium]|nr:hypothetical protein [Chloroflexota bacterium]